MESQIPLPTDNIYKFYALFGLVLFVFSAGSVIYITDSSNDKIFQIANQYEAVTLVDKPSATDLQKKHDLEVQLNIIKSNRTFITLASGGIAGIATILVWYGFQKWHKEIQPIEDEMAKLQLEKLRHEVKQLKKEA